MKTRSKTDQKSYSFPRAKTWKHATLLSKQSTRFASGSARPVHDRALSGWSGNNVFFVLLGFRMYAYEFLKTKPTW